MGMAPGVHAKGASLTGGVTSGSCPTPGSVQEIVGESLFVTPLSAVSAAAPDPLPAMSRAVR